MKFLMVFAVFAIVLSVQALTEEQKQKLKEHFKICQKNTGAEDKYLGRIQKNDFDFEDAKTKDWVFCVFRRTEIMDENGKFLKENALSKVEDEIKEKVSKAIDVCIKTKVEENNETAWNFAKCYVKERPDHDMN